MGEENTLAMNAIGRVKFYYEAGFKAALSLVEMSSLEEIKANADTILENIFNITFAEKEDEDADGSE